MLPTPRSYVRADGAVAPDHWLEPRIVWEVKCADLSLSPIYPAARGLVSDLRGLGWTPQGDAGGRAGGAWRGLPSWVMLGEQACVLFGVRHWGQKFGVFVL